MRRPSDDILLLLKTRGPTPTLGIAEQLRVSRQAARVQLEKLSEEGLVEHASVRAGVGRPSRSWSLTEAGNARFPDAHAQMTAELITAVREEFGPEGLERLVARRERATAETYRRAMAGAVSLEDRLARLAGLRQAEGYMARWLRQGDGSYLLIEDHCPICVAAAACQGFCRTELDLFRSLLAPARVERTEHALAGARRCAYRVSINQS
jgi:predicted ArsR family transcriptional regulator